MLEKIQFLEALTPTRCRSPPAPTYDATHI